MVDLNEAQNGIRNDDGPQIIAENTIYNKQNATQKVYDADFGNIFQYKTQHDKKRSTVANKIRNFRGHKIKFKRAQT